MTRPLSALGLAVLLLAGVVAGQDSLRETPAVRLIAGVQAGVLPVFTRTGPNSVGAGSGAVIHPAGFILTADHVTQSFPGVVLFGLQRVDYEIVGRVPERDVALLKVDPRHVTATIPIGRSHDLRAGEPIIVGGNPGGRGIIFSQGSINAPSIDPSWPNVLVTSYWRTDLDQARERQTVSTGGRPTFIQFDAISNRGNSGGPLINYEGQLIGLVATKSFHEEGINWAIPSDRIRLLTPHLVDPEVVNGFSVGLQVDLLAAEAQVTQVRSGSPAEQSGLQVGDVLLSVNQQPVRSGPEWSLLLHGHRVGDVLQVDYRRGAETRSANITCGEPVLPTAVAEDGRQPGIRYQLYKGRFPQIPDWSQLKSTQQGDCTRIGYEGIVAADATEFGIVFSGYVRFPEAGLYRLHLTSDDASRLFIDDQLVIDNDLPHPEQKLSRWVRVPAGLVPFRVEYAETSGEKSLSLLVTRDYDTTSPVALEFFRDPDQP